ncbi:hypothetical protein ACFLXH_04520 [Chloroflexota bacterium]
MTPEEEIKQAGIQYDADQVGIASVAAINRYAPPGHRPDDILKGAKSVIVLAGHMTLKGAWQSPDQRSIAANRVFPRTGSGVAAAVARFIESKFGYYSVGETPAPTGFNPSLSLKLCAEMAGLGTRSMAAGILLNEKLGMLSLAAGITTMPLKADGPLKEPVCPHPSCMKLWEKQQVTPCLETCPECLSGELAEDKIKWMRYDRRICSTRAQTTGTGAFLRMLVECFNEPDPEIRRNILLGSFSRNTIQAITANAAVGQCSECLRNCPIYLRTRNLKEKILDPQPL